MVTTTMLSDKKSSPIVLYCWICDSKIDIQCLNAIPHGIPSYSTPSNIRKYFQPCNWSINIVNYQCLTIYSTNNKQMVIRRQCGYDDYHYSCYKNQSDLICPCDYNGFVGDSHNSSLEKSFLTLTSFTSLIFLVIIHVTFQTQNCNALRTYLLYIGGDDNILDQMNNNNDRNYSRSTVTLFRYIEKNILNRKYEFRQLFNRVYCFAQIFHLYSPLMIAANLILIGFRNVKHCRHIIRYELSRYRSIMINNNNDNYYSDMKTKSSTITVIQWEIKKATIIFIRTIIFAEEVQKYLSRLLLWALIVTIVASQITRNCLEHLINHQSTYDHKDISLLFSMS
ncbi:hypothetical protein HUG17_6277 [Dermatophagoides farinae]|uniref:Uncharacterized protein n=1 Tax=Dermatophagoides farinae TaxID=6954 RepID=A0A9D4SJZ9_DERFA|nr:hypothetical protein HUG17_6277 [Dermatophagoides farinae]